MPNDTRSLASRKAFKTSPRCPLLLEDPRRITIFGGDIGDEPRPGVGGGSFAFSCRDGKLHAQAHGSGLSHHAALAEIASPTAMFGRVASPHSLTNPSLLAIDAADAAGELVRIELVIIMCKTSFLFGHTRTL